MAATTGQLGLVTPTQGTLSGTWGDTVNNGITEYTNIAIAGTLSFAGDGAITLANTTGDASATNIGATTAQYMAIRITGTQTVAKVITGPSYSKLYLVDHAGATSAVEFKRAGQVTAVSIAVGEKCFVYYNGTDYVKISSTIANSGGSNTQVQYNNGGNLAGSANLTFDGTTLTANNFIDSSLTASKPVFTDASKNLVSTGTLGTDQGGTNLTSFTSGGALYATSTSALTTGTLPVASGGTSQTAYTTGDILYASATNTLSKLAVGASGNVLTVSSSVPVWSAPVAGGIAYTAVKTANYTAVNNDGVLTNTTGGAFTVTLPTSPSVGNIVVVVDSFGQWGTNNLTVDPTALIKIAGNTAGDTLTCDITGATVTLVYTGATYGWNVSAQVGGNGGTAVTLTGVQTLTNKTIAFGSNTLSDVASLSTAQTFTGTKTFSGTSSATAIVLNDAAEVATVSATAATGTIAYDITTQSVLYYTTNASANWTVNFRGSSGTSLDTLMTTGQSMTAAFLVTQGATAYYNNVVQVDGTTSGVTTRWLGGAPTAGNASGIDSYRYLIIKTGSATFTVFASNTQFKA
jgi:hypothetical protein